MPALKRYLLNGGLLGAVVIVMLPIVYRNNENAPLQAAGLGSSESSRGLTSAAQPTESVERRTTPVRNRPAPPASTEFAKERNAMVTQTIERPWDGRARVKDKAVLAAM